MNPKIGIHLGAGTPHHGEPARTPVSIVRFDYQFARATRTAAQAMNEGVGVCRDFTHLAIALCRAMNIPARYCNGFLGDIGVPPDPAPMDYNAWFEAYLGGQWYIFDARHNMPRIGRVLVARGRDAADIPMIHTFGPHTLQKFEVITEKVTASWSGRRVFCEPGQIISPSLGKRRASDLCQD